MKWYTILGVAGLLGLMATLAILSVKDDSATNDEIAHIAAGYSYLTAQDYRLNPEHPPLAKDLAALPLLFMDLKFPWEHSVWTEDVNNQWGAGQLFLYELGNDADAMLFWSRTAMVFLLIALGYLLFHWSRRLLGTAAAFFVLALFTLSPNFLAHGSLVTTDVAAALGVVLALYWFLQFLYVPSWKNAIVGGGVLAVALLMKFSTIILLPLFGVLFLLYWQLLSDHLRTRPQFFLYLKRGVGMALVAVLLLGAVYQFHILNYPAEHQLRDSKEILGAYYGIPPEDVSFSIAASPVLRPYAHYLLGLLRSTQRVQMQSIDYFLRETGPTGWPHYFPVLYAVKIPLAFHLLSFAAIAGGVFAHWTRRRSSSYSLREWLREHFSFVAMGTFVAMYSAIALASPMQIGFRHLLPMLPFVYILAAAGVVRLLRCIPMPMRVAATAGVAVLLGWYTVSSLFVFPHYLSYYNEFAGGSSNGYTVAGHSNYDWGQDAKRFAQWVERKGIEKIYVDFFGRGDLAYYLGEKYVAWHGSSWWELHGFDTNAHEEFPRENYLAVSSYFLVSGGWTAEGYSRTRDYAWLDGYEQVGRAGQSIFIYYIP